jgi:paraquat-inducible protein A
MLLRALATFRPWAMPEVFMLGALVALVKLSAMATVVPQISLACYGLFMMALAALISTTPTEQLWQWAERCRA